MTLERKPFFTWLIIITALGCALRVYHLIDVPFTYDELSALHRTHFASFHELIRKGISVDGHPAGVQVFLFYYTKLVGETEWLVKLPFILMGILCIPFIYRIGARWFSRDAGIISACLVACLQYTVTFSQVARPYVSGLFLVLLLVLIWNELIVKITYRNLIAFAVVSALCAYNHYFSLLTSACVAVTGLFVINRKGLPKYILAVLLAFVFFIPHIHLFFEQLKLKGLEWLQAPTPDFFANYLYYVFNFSAYVIVAVLLLIGQGIYLSIHQAKSPQNKFRFIALLWFVIPAGIGFLYSVYRAPVIQNSVLIFSFPFLILFACSFIVLPNGWLRDVEIGALLLILAGSLVSERHYYTLFYNQETEMFARYISGFEQVYGLEKVAAVANTNPDYLDSYKTKYKTDWSYQTFQAVGDNNAWRKWLASSNKKYLILCNPPVEWNSQYLAIAEEYFPCHDSIYHGFTTDIYVLKKDQPGCPPDLAPLFTYTLKDSTGVRYKHKIPPLSIGNGDIYMTCDTFNSPVLFESPVRQLSLDEKMKINVSVDVYVDSLGPEGSLTLQFNDGSRVLQERKSLIQSFAGNDTGWHTVYLSARLYHSPVNKAAYIRVDLVGRPKKSCLTFKNFKVEAVKDNPLLYSLIKKQ